MFGAEVEDLDEWLGCEVEPDYFEVWPENWLVLEVFLEMAASQWIWTGGMESRRAGLNFAALPVYYEGLEVPPERRPEVFRGLRLMEMAALDAMTPA